MAAPPGNKFWQLASSIGRDAIFSDGEVLRAEAEEYFKWCDRNPWLKAELVKHKGDAEEYSVPLGRPYSIDGLTIYLGVSPSYFRSRKAALLEKQETKRITDAELGVLYAIERIELIVGTQQKEGAAVRVFDSNLIARWQGMADNVNTHATGETGIRVTVRDQKTADMLDELDSVL